MIHAYAARQAGGKLTPFEYEPGPLNLHDVDIDVEHCGICYSDISMLDNEWGMTQYPLVPGHEVIGKIKAVGEQVAHLKVGDRVGLGWHAGYCMCCSNCLGGDHNMCTGASGTIVGRHGGFADQVRAEDVSVIKLPDSLDPSKAGPLFCGGNTVFSPLLQHNISPTAHIAVIGIGGLGHLALQFAKAWGAHVTAVTSTESKQAQALELGAHETLNSRDAKAIESAAGRFDLILSTVNVSLDWNAYINTLKPNGRLHFLGAVMEPLNLNLFPILMGQRVISSSPVGGPNAIARMLDFAARHKIHAVTEHFKFDQVNEALDHLRSGNARYRVVLSY